MSRTYNTARAFDTNTPNWLIWKLIIKQDRQGVRLAERPTAKNAWRKELEREWRS